MTNICRSGGARGADTVWGNVATEHGHSVAHYSFEGHSTTVPKDQLVILDRHALAMANASLVEANKTLQRRLPMDGSPIRKLLQRNWWQVRDVESVYAVSRIVSGKVLGGTAWAVQMFLNRETHGPCYVYDLISGGWFQYGRHGWELIDRPPAPEGVYAGIGTRDPETDGIQAIRDVYG